MNTQKREIKETLELIEGIKVIAIFGAKVVADGKVDFRDLEHLKELAKQIDIIFSAFNNVQEVVEEIQELDTSERDMLLNEFVDIAKSIRDNVNYAAVSQ